jgi:hypothetical protein
VECLTSGVLRGNYLFFFSKVHRARDDPGGATMAAATTKSRNAKPQSRVAAGSPRAVARPGFPQIRACPIKAHGSSCHVFATDGTLSGSLSLAEAGNAPTRDRIEPKASDGPVCDEKASASIFLWQHSGIAPAHWSYQ